MTHTSGQPNTQLENLLAVLTEAILAEEGDIDRIISSYAVSRAEVEGFVRIVRRLHTALIGVRPSRRFVHRLKQDLMGQPHWNVISRIRFLPPRVQIAAGIALLAGFMLLSRRRILTLAREEAIAEAVS
jgi:hypothetical protein